MREVFLGGNDWEFVYRVTNLNAAPRYRAEH